MIVRRFLSWVHGAPAGARAEATSALARAYLYSGFDDAERADAEIALTAMLDDPSPLVRRALAEAFACSRGALRPCISALAGDQSDIASIVLARSPLLSDEELMEYAAIGDVYSQSAIALRPGLSSDVAAALTEIGAREALITLAVNPSAEVTEAVLRRMLDRFGDDGEMREAILARADLSPALRADLVAATAEALSSFVVAREWLSEERACRLIRDSVEKGVVLIAADGQRAPGQGSAALAARLRRGGRLTPSLALRALFSSDMGLFEAILVELSAQPAVRVAGIVRRPDASGFGALYARAGFPPALLPIFQAAIRVQFASPRENLDGKLCLKLVTLAQERCAAAPFAPGLQTILRQFEAEAVREFARHASASMVVSLAPATRPPIEIDLAAIEAELAA